MTIEGVDLSYDRPGGAALVAAGKHFVIRYVPVTGDGGHGLTAAEVTDYHAHGLGICLVWESTPGRMVTGGFAGGAADATVAKAKAAGLGFPPDRPIYFACDREVYSTDFPAIDAYMKGVGSILGLSRAGIYGQATLCTHLRTVSLASWFWQTLAWSAGVVLSWIHLYQRLNSQTINGAAVDFDTAYQADYGQWGGTVQTFTSLPPRVGTVTVKSDAAHSFLRLSDGKLFPVGGGTIHDTFGEIKLAVPIPGGTGDRQTGWLIGAPDAAFLLATDVTFTADAAPSVPVPAPIVLGPGLYKVGP